MQVLMGGLLSSATTRALDYLCESGCCFSTGYLLSANRCAQETFTPVPAVRFQWKHQHQPSTMMEACNGKEGGCE